MFSRLIAVLAFLFVVTGAQAQTPWSSAGTACVPAGATNGHYQSSGLAGVRHLGAETGSIVFTCQIEAFTAANTAWAVQLNYRDSTGDAASGRALARLYSMPLGGFAPVLIATASSNSSDVTTNNIIFSDVFVHTFNFNANVYFMQVTLTRDASSEIVLLHSVSITLVPG